MRVRNLLAVAVVAAGAGGLTEAPALAAAGTTVKHVQTFPVKPQQKLQLAVDFPNALEYATAKYAGSVTVVGAVKGAKGSAPKVSLVKILSKGRGEGGSAYLVEVKNNNAAGTAPVAVKVTAATTLPPGVKG